LPSFLKRLSNERILDIVKHSLPQTLMPKFEFLKDEQIKDIVSFLRTPALKLQWNREDILKTHFFFKTSSKRLNIENFNNITLVVERGANRVWIMENEKVLDWFDFKNVHGGLKFRMNKDGFLVPTRDGWIGKYSFKEGRLKEKIRACINLRNVSISRDGEKIFATCLLPQMVVVLDYNTMKPLKIEKVKGKISALYELYSQDKAVFTLRDKPIVGVVDTKSLKFTYKKIEKPIEDFFIDPFEEYIIGTTRRGSKLTVFRLDNFEEIFEENIEGMPHLFSATYWYKDGKFYFATPHLRKPYITIWQMYDWKLVKKMDVGGDGFFVKTHPASRYLWVDNGSDEIVLIDKESYKITKKRVLPKKRYIHTEFSGDGKIAYLSIYENNGALIVYETDTFREIRRYFANIPVGKYNFINKNRVFYPKLFGETIFKEKCWGCHHQTAEAFGPSFRTIANKRTKEEIMAHISNPSEYFSELGYKRNSMPSFGLNYYELKSITDYIKSFKGN